MTIEQLGSIGEFVSAIAVIASVLYLALQIRHGAVASRSAAIHAVTSHFSRMQFDSAADGALSDLMTRASAGEALTAVDKNRLYTLYSAYMLGFENLWEQQRAGVFSRTSYDARRVIIAQQLAGPMARRWWQHQGRHVHPPEFVAEVDAIIADTDRLLGPLRTAAAPARD
ncbi:MAG TPA: hypothetical protein VLA56_09625 [Pseudomonadales bacterium]|nr:hypothetical protein [Pseudomonadales bacterium]